MVPGRSVSACMRAYDLLNASAGASIPFPLAEISEQSPAAIEQPSSATKSRKKRPAPREGLTTPSDRSIQALPFATVNTPGDSVGYGAAVGSSNASGEPPQKKRGRPKKEEHERRVREAAQRGEIYPPPKKAKTPRQSLEGTAGAALSGMTEDGSASRNKAKNQKTASSAGHLAPEVPARTSSLEAIASGADQVQIEVKKNPPGTMTEMQTSDLADQEDPLKGMQEHTRVPTKDEPNIELSASKGSSTLKQDLEQESEQNIQATTTNPRKTTA